MEASPLPASTVSTQKVTPEPKSAPLPPKPVISEVKPAHITPALVVATAP
jgi:hypothetical protein